jgi:hemoglobin
MRSILEMKIVVAALLASAMVLMGGCGDSPKTQDKNYFTSGSPEADQRADERMAQAQQLHGDSGTKSLYDRLGGQPGIVQITDDFVTRALADPRVNFDRQDVKQGGLSIHRGKSETWDANADNVKMLKLHLAQFLALATGGPSVYEGKQMGDAHKNLHITNAEFDASVGDLKATLDKLQIASKEQKELLAIIETTREQVVTEKSD